MIRELNYNELKRFDVQNLIANRCIDDESEVLPKIIGQRRAEKALKFGLNVKGMGYNIFVSGMPGLGKTAFAKAFAEEIAKRENRPKDFCYIYNFKNPQYPELLTFEAGKGRAFKEEMEELIGKLIHEFPQVFNDDDFEEEKHEIIRSYQDKRENVIKLITDDARRSNFGVKMTNSGIYFMPIINGEIISEEEYDELCDEIKNDISAKSEEIQTKALETMRQINGFERATQQEIDALEYKVGLFALGRHINKLCEQYKDNERVFSYLLNVKEDILENMDGFMQEDSQESDVLQNIMPWVSKKTKEDFLSKYKVNLLTDNSDSNGAPVIIDFNPTYSNLVGEVEYDSEFGNFISDYMKIRPGLLHKANGGYLILQVKDVISNPHVWETLKRVIRTKKLSIESMREYTSSIAVTSIKPEPIDIDFKLILVGSGFYYDILSEYDDEFQKYFKINAIFDYEMDFEEENIKDLIDFIKNAAKEEGMCSFDCGGISKVIEYSMRLCESQDKLTTRFGRIREILLEASAWAKMDGKETVTAEYIDKAIFEKQYRANVYEEKITELIEKNIIMIETDGDKIAQINGLAVFDTGDHIFAKPTKITATTYVGKSGIINIEKEAEMSGAIHDKGIEVIVGYLGQRYAQDFPLSLSCRVCFEQNYSGVDGDSASSTELYAILSSLADAPIRQDIAVTGSMNQRGEIQAIGGVTYKIEGFFNLCKRRGLTGKQGVIIPIQNISDLVLNDEVIEAVCDGKFHIYSISTTDDGIELLTGIPAGVKNEKGKYPTDSIHGRVYKKLREFYKKSIE